MKRTKHAIFAFVTCAAMFALTGCGDSKQVSEVKAMPFSYPSDNVQDPNLTVDQALDHRKICASTKWQVLMTEQHQNVVQYDCTFEGVEDSLLMTVDKKQQPPNYMFPDKIGDLYQWTYGADGKPELSYVALHYHFPNGTTKDIRSSGPIASDGGLNFTGTGWVVMLMEEAVKQNIETYDQFRSDLYGVHIPVKPASPITDTTYGNTLSKLYPDKSPTIAAVLAYLWQGAPTEMRTFGIDKLGYLRVQHDPAYYHLLFPVNPADVQISTKDDSAKPNDTPPKPPQLSPDKLYCVNEQCYDSDQGLVGRAPASILAQETGSSGSAQRAAQVQQPVQSPSQQAMQQAVQQDTATQTQGSGAKVTMSTYGNVVASFYPGKPPLDAMQDALTLIHSELSVTDMAPSGYPEYQVECESNGECVGGTGTPMGAVTDVATEMFPVNPMDIGRNGIACDQYVCKDGKGNVIGRNPSIVAR